MQTNQPSLEYSSVLEQSLNICKVGVHYSGPQKHLAWGGDQMKWFLQKEDLLVMDETSVFFCQEFLREELLSMAPLTQYTLPPFPLLHRVCSGVPWRWGKTGAMWKELGRAREPLCNFDQCGWSQQGKALSRQPEIPWASIIVKKQFWRNVTVALENSEWMTLTQTNQSQ